MGLPMDSMHAPTVAAGSASDARWRSDAELDQIPLTELISKKETAEAELQALASVLESHGVDMTTLLITPDGYPRDDLDIAQICTTRARIIHLRNDYRGLMSRIEDGLHKYHASLSPEQMNTSSSQPIQESSRPRVTESGATVDIPFAKVNSVATASPSERAGLKAGDLLKRIGDVNWMNHEKLRRVGEVVQQNEGRALRVLVRRHTEPGDNDLELQLIPRNNWGGRGLLGCHLVLT